MRTVLGRPPQAVVDACVFGHLNEWVKPLVDAARSGDVELIWSPVIIAETNRLLTWRWLQRHGGDLSPQSWRACAADAKRFLREVHPAFSIVDDRPPNELLWADRPRDEWDIPLWNAAVRSRADFVVTDNLADGPPPDSDGVRRHDGIVFVHPNDFLEMLAAAAERHAAEDLPIVDEE